MAEVVNLRLARKGKARRDREAAAAANRVAHGAPKAATRAGEALRAIEARRLDGHRLDRHSLDRHSLDRHSLDRDDA